MLYKLCELYLHPYILCLSFLFAQCASPLESSISKIHMVQKNIVCLSVLIHKIATWPDIWVAEVVQPIFWAKFWPKIFAFVLSGNHFAQ